MKDEKKNGLNINELGDMCWYWNEELHREDGPAVEIVTKEGLFTAYYLCGIKLSEREYNLITANKDQIYSHTCESKFQNTKNPESPCSLMTYWLNCKLHRDDGPALEFSNGNKIWYKKGIKHRDNSPAEEGWTGFLAWFKSGKRHREDGPAVIRPGGDIIEYWIEDKNLKEEEFKAWVLEKELEQEVHHANSNKRLKV